jgi:hypothetical protein
MTRQVKYGCLTAALAVFVLVGVWVYVGIVRPAQAVLDDLDLVATLAPMNEGIVNQDPFVPPPGNELTEEALQRFSRIQETMQTGLGEADFALLNERSRTLMGMFDGDGEDKLRDVSLKTAVMALDGLGPVLVRAKGLQIAGINQEGLSLAEYRWTRERFYRALGFSRANIYFEDFAAAMKAGKNTAPPPEDTAPPPERNRDLAALYSDSVDGWHAFMIFGL